MVSTAFPKYDENFTVNIGFKGQKEEKELTKSIACWFDSEGGFAEDIFVKDVKQLLADAEKSNWTGVKKQIIKKDERKGSLFLGINIIIFGSDRLERRLYN